MVVVVFFNDTATIEIYTYLPTLSLHDALPISGRDHPSSIWHGAAGSAVSIISPHRMRPAPDARKMFRMKDGNLQKLSLRPMLRAGSVRLRSEEHTSELQSLMRISYAVFCLKKKKNTKYYNNKHKHTNNHITHKLRTTLNTHKYLYTRSITTSTE